MQVLHRLSGTLQDVSSALVQRGTAMGPLVPSLVLVPFLLLFAWLFRDTAVVGGIPIISAVLVIAGLLIPSNFHRHFGKFAKTDPDRLQSEEFRIGMTRIQMVDAKSLPQPLSEDSLPEPTRNLTDADARHELDEANEAASDHEGKAP